MTVEYPLTSDTWVKVAGNDDDFLLENGSFAPIRICYVTADGPAPALDAPYHYLRGREALVRVATGDLYARADSVDGVVVVSI